MQIPDRAIVRKVKEYDPYLFIEWNNRDQWFELWRVMPHGRRLVTPITRSIYNSKEPREFVPLDERLLWWLFDADSWRNGGSKQHALTADQRWREFHRTKDEKRFREYYDYAKDVWAGANAFYTTRHAKKNGKPKLKAGSKRFTGWIRPDSQSLTSPRLFKRSTANAKAYGFRK